MTGEVTGNGTEKRMLIKSFIFRLKSSLQQLIGHLSKYLCTASCLIKVSDRNKKSSFQVAVPLSKQVFAFHSLLISLSFLSSSSFLPANSDRGFLASGRCSHKQHLNFNGRQHRRCNHTTSKGAFFASPDNTVLSQKKSATSLFLPASIDYIRLSFSFYPFVQAELIGHINDII